MRILDFFKISVIIFLSINCHNLSAKSFAQNSKNYDVTITSNLIDIKKKSQTINFIDNVVIKNGPDIMTAQKVVLFYKKSKNSNKNEIDIINAYNDVKIFAADFVATAELGYYNPKQSLFTLEKDVIVNNGNSIGVGDKFIYNLTTKQGEFITKTSKINNKKDNRVSITIDNKKEKK